MYRSKPNQINNFFVAGISYKTTDAVTRSQFALSDTHYEEVLKLSPGLGLDTLFILSTCNRTEIYGFADSAQQLISLLCTQTTGTIKTFNKSAYSFQGFEAISHLFRVGTGLDSQIVGDYEIVGQLKRAFKFAKDRGFINSFLERLFNTVLQASKAVKSKTSLSSGTVSASYAAVQFIKNSSLFKTNKKILLIGTGKIGRNTCKNMVDYLTAAEITIINRTDESAAEVAADLHVRHAPIADMALEVAAADIIVAATNASQPILLKEHLEHKGAKLIVDLSIPYNVTADAERLPNVVLVNIDALSKINDDTLQLRIVEVPKAITIIESYAANFMNWYLMNQRAIKLQELKTLLTKMAILESEPQLNHLLVSRPYFAAEQRVQAVLNGVAEKIRNQQSQGCYYMEAISEYINRFG